MGMQQYISSQAQEFLHQNKVMKPIKLPAQVQHGTYFQISQRLMETDTGQIGSQERAEPSITRCTGAAACCLNASKIANPPNFPARH